MSYEITYHPKGSMCANCKKIKDDCSKLPFEKMQVIKQTTSFRKLENIVNCWEFEHK